jgi:hypothetical protein
MTDKALRVKYGWLLDDKLQALACAGGVTAMLCLAGYYQSTPGVKNNELQCLAEYPYQLWIGVLLVATPALMLIIKKLSDVHEITGLKQELMRSLIGFWCCGSPYFVLIALQVQAGTPLHCVLALSNCSDVSPPPDRNTALCV